MIVIMVVNIIKFLLSQVINNLMNKLWYKYLQVYYMY